LKSATLPCRMHVAARVDDDVVDKDKDKASVVLHYYLYFVNHIIFILELIDSLPFLGLAGFSVLCQHATFVVAQDKETEKWKVRLQRDYEEFV
jgi:hypothetical protein